MKAAGIDLGSNSFRLLVAEITARSFQTIRKELETVRLGKGLIGTRKLAPENMARSFTVLRIFKDILLAHKPTSVRACGTAALRYAENSAEFLQRAAEILDMEVEVLNGKDEALLNLYGARFFMDTSINRPLLLMDVGGGSTELILSQDWITAIEYVSLPIGAVGLTEMYLKNEIVGPGEITAINRAIKRTLAEALVQFSLNTLPARPHIAATGGTATALAAIDLNLREYDEQRVQGHVIAKKRITDIFDRLCRMTPSARNCMPGLEKGRGEIILAGVSIYRVLLDLIGSSKMEVSDAGLLEGIVLSTMPEENLKTFTIRHEKQ